MRIRALNTSRAGALADCPMDFSYETIS